MTDAEPFNPVPQRTDRHAATGRFQPGNKAAVGRAAPQALAALRQAVTAAVTPDEVRTVVRKLYDLAVGGNVQAAALLLDRLCGKPQPAAFDEEGGALRIDAAVLFASLRARYGGDDDDDNDDETDVPDMPESDGKREGGAA